MKSPPILSICILAMGSVWPADGSGLMTGGMAKLSLNGESSSSSSSNHASASVAGGSNDGGSWSYGGGSSSFGSAAAAQGHHSIRRRPPRVAYRQPVRPVEVGINHRRESQERALDALGESSSRNPRRTTVLGAIPMNNDPDFEFGQQSFEAALRQPVRRPQPQPRDRSPLLPGRRVASHDDVRRNPRGRGSQNPGRTGRRTPERTSRRPQSALTNSQEQETCPGVMLIIQDGMLVHYASVTMDDEPTSLLSQQFVARNENPYDRRENVDESPDDRREPESTSRPQMVTYMARRPLFPITLAQEPKVVYDSSTKRLLSLSDDPESCEGASRCILVIDIHSGKTSAFVTVPDAIFPANTPVLDLAVFESFIYVHGVQPDTNEYVIYRVPIPGGQLAPDADDTMGAYPTVSGELEDSETTDAEEKNSYGHRVREVEYQQFAVVCSNCEAEEAGMSPGRLFFYGPGRRVAVVLDFGTHRTWYVLLDLDTGKLLGEHACPPLASYVGIDPDTGRLLMIRVTHKGVDNALSLHAMNLETAKSKPIGDLPKDMTVGGDAVMVPDLRRFYVKMTEPSSPLVLILGIDYVTGKVVDDVRPLAKDFPLAIFYYPMCFPPNEPSSQLQETDMVGK